MSADPNHLLAVATRRVKIPALPFRVEYDPDVDTLYIRFKEGVSPTHSKDDPDKGVVYDYRGRSLIGIEILDASQDWTDLSKSRLIKICKPKNSGWQ